MKQIRKGTYTKKSPLWRRAMNVPKRVWYWYKALPLWKKIGVIVGPLLLLAIIIPVVTYLYFANDIADQERLMNRNNTGVVFLDKNGEVFYSVGKAQHEEMVPLSEISDDMEHALVASEDKNFYEHNGFSIPAIIRAAVTGYGGGSTISQQLAKNTLLSDKYSYLRKYQELFMSIAIENHYTKDQILEMYLNSVYYGENTFGIADAADRYFGKTPDELNLAESATLVGLLPAPSVYSPISGDPAKAKERQEIVLSRMVENNYITEEQKQQALATELTYKEYESTVTNAPHFVEMVMKQLNDTYGDETVMRSGYQVTTTLDIAMQEKLSATIDDNIARVQARGGSNSSAVAIDPKTGEVRALVGSADYYNEQWGMVNMTTTARQPASTFKPIYYAAALASGTITPATVLSDEAVNIGGWQPKNADRQFRGDVTVREALDWSLNIPSIEVMQKYGVDRSIAAAQAMHIDLQNPKDAGLTLAIGSSEATLLDMTNAYAAFANQGKQFAEPIIITGIKDKFDNKIFTSNAESEQVISADGAFLISDILADNTTRSQMFGSSLNVNGHTAAVKTGTNDNQLDAWTIGYTPSLTVGVWVGNNDNTPMSGGGSAMAGPIWREAMNSILSGQANEAFPVSNGVVEKSICSSNYGLVTNGVTEGTFREYFLSTALPTTTCAPEEKVEIEVCRLDTLEIVTIDEKEFDATKYSKTLADCDEPVEDDSLEIDVCELATGDVITIDESDFDETLHSTDTESCAPPEELEPVLP